MKLGATLLDKEHVRIVGSVTRLSKEKSEGMQIKSYDVSWEPTAAGESSVNSTYKLVGCQIGYKIERIRTVVSRNATGNNSRG
jgi:hypothetical protein